MKPCWLSFAHVLCIVQLIAHVGKFVVCVKALRMCLRLEDFASGHPRYGVRQVVGADNAFCAIREDGSVVTWGDAAWR